MGRGGQRRVCVWGGGGGEKWGGGGVQRRGGADMWHGVGEGRSYRK